MINLQLSSLLSFVTTATHSSLWAEFNCKKYLGTRRTSWSSSYVACCGQMKCAVMQRWLVLPMGLSGVGLKSPWHSSAQTSRRGYMLLWISTSPTWVLTLKTRNTRGKLNKSVGALIVTGKRIPKKFHLRLWAPQLGCPWGCQLSAELEALGAPSSNLYLCYYLCALRSVISD